MGGVNEGRMGGTYARSMLPRVWSCFTILTVAALGIFVSSVTSTLKVRYGSILT